MTNINITNFRKNVFDYVSQAIEFNEVVNISTKNGNAVIMSEEDYNSLMETLYLSGYPNVKKEIIEGLKTPIEECIPEDEVAW